MKLEKQAPPSTSLTGAFSPPPELEAKWLASKYLGQEYTEQMPFGVSAVLARSSNLEISIPSIPNRKMKIGIGLKWSIRRLIVK